MKPTSIVHTGALNDSQLAQLADQMDPAIGEATSVLGAMASELIRRTLRGGVMELGRELNGYVGQLVEAQIIEQRPAIDKAAAETATEVARGEVEAVRQSVNDQGQTLAARIDGVSRQTQEQVEAVTRDLVGQLQTTSRQTLDQVDAVSRDLTGQLQAQSRRTEEKVEAVAGDLASRLEATTSLARTLETEVVATGTRTLDTARKEFTEQIDVLREGSRQASLKIKERLDKADAAIVQLTEQKRALHAELLAAMATDRNNLLQEIKELRKANEVLAGRVSELEKPRGLRALFAWLFGRKKKPVAEE